MECGFPDSQMHTFSPDCRMTTSIWCATHCEKKKLGSSHFLFAHLFDFNFSICFVQEMHIHWFLHCGVLPSSILPTCGLHKRLFLDEGVVSALFVSNVCLYSLWLSKREGASKLL